MRPIYVVLTIALTPLAAFACGGAASAQSPSWRVSPPASAKRLTTTVHGPSLLCDLNKSVRSGTTQSKRIRSGSGPLFLLCEDLKTAKPSTASPLLGLSKETTVNPPKVGSPAAKTPTTTPTIGTPTARLPGAQQPSLQRPATQRPGTQLPATQQSTAQRSTTPPPTTGPPEKSPPPASPLALTRPRSLKLSGVDPNTVFLSTSGAWMANNLATRKTTTRFLQGVTGDAKLARRLAPTALKISRSLPARAGLAVAVLASGGLALYEGGAAIYESLLGGDDKPSSAPTSAPRKPVEMRYIGYIDATGTFRPAPGSLLDRAKPNPTSPRSPLSTPAR